MTMNSSAGDETCSEPVVWVLAVAARWAAVAVRFVAVLVRVLLLVHVVVMLSALLWAWWAAVAAALVRALVVVVFIRGHQVAPLVSCGVVSCVVGKPCLLALLVLRQTTLDQDLLQCLRYTRTHSSFKKLKILLMNLNDQVCGFQCIKTSCSVEVYMMTHVKK